MDGPIMKTTKAMVHRVYKEDHLPAPPIHSQDLNLNEITRLLRTLTSDVTKLKQDKEGMASRILNEPIVNLAPFQRPFPPHPQAKETRPEEQDLPDPLMSTSNIVLSYV